MIDTSLHKLQVRADNEGGRRASFAGAGGEKMAVSFQKATAGSHIEIHLPNGQIRQYSVSRMPPEVDFYENRGASGDE